MIIPRSRVCGLIALACVVGTTYSTTLAAQFVVVETKTHRIASRFIDQVYEIHVAVPPHLEDNSERFPVLYMTDANTGIAFDQITQIMQLGGDIPRFIIVGIGYPVEHAFGGLALRNRDLTQVEFTSPATESAARMPFRGVPMPAGKRTGGADAFLDFIREQVIPFIDENYPTISGDRGYFGDSLGGLFGLYALFSKPDSFHRYIIGSPSTWWADEAVMRQAEQYVASHDDLKARVFMAAGALEEVGAQLAPFRMVTNIYRLEKLLRDANFPGLSVTTEVYPDETHTTVIALNYIRGVRAVYGRPEMSFIQAHMMRSAPEQGENK